ncbi:acyltransferase [Marinobacter sp. NSM]|uniref:acyltransferase n=1 Tax=Marinobacter sp. NSM TaxID=3458004 RepID=UPI00403519E3
MKLFILKVKRAINIIRLAISNLVYYRSDFASCGERVFLHDGVKIFNPEFLTIYDDVYVGPGTKIFSYGSIEIRQGAVIGEGVQIMSSSHEYDSPGQDVLPFSSKNVSKKTVLSEFCWIGNNSIILPGVSVGKYCVIGAGSVVTKSTQDYGVYGGNPARLLKFRENKDLSRVDRTWIGEKNKNSIYFVR